jgi:hypothetical protein
MMDIPISVKIDHQFKLHSFSEYQYVTGTDELIMFVWGLVMRCKDQ